MLSIVFGVAASLFGIWAALSEVRDSQDDFIADQKNKDGVPVLPLCVQRHRASSLLLIFLVPQDGWKSAARRAVPTCPLFELWEPIRTRIGN
jgi:hypothetical protein